MPSFWRGWRESGNPYRRHKSRRDLELVLRLLRPEPRQRVLEVGCGYGWVSRAIWKAAPVRWVGMDPSADMIEALRAAAPERASAAFVGDGRALPFASNAFDAVLCTGVLMHVREDLEVIGELVRTLRPGGRLVVSVNNAMSPYALPVRLWNRGKDGYVQQFRNPWRVQRTLRARGICRIEVAGDGIVATTPIERGKVRFPPIRLAPGLCRLDRAVTERVPRLAYEVWFAGTKASSLEHPDR
jgi:SAM-dependent methyltransferase